MSVSYHINHEQGLITVTGIGRINLDDARPVGHALLKEPHFDTNLPQLIDFRGVTFRGDGSSQQQFEKFVISEYCPEVASSIAVVIDDSVDPETCAQMYKMSCAVDDAELFDNYDQALRWLMRREFATADAVSSAPQH